jgi:hypothetical protein
MAANNKMKICFGVGFGSSEPEPGTWALILPGFGLMAALGWQRKRAARHAV